MNSRRDNAVFDRADALHSNAIIINGHDHMATLTDFEWNRQAGVTAKVVHVSLDVVIWDDEPDCYKKYKDTCDGYAERADRAIAQIHQHVRARPERLMVVRSSADVLEAHRTGRLGLILGFEGAKPLQDRLELLDRYYELGVRHIQLTWAVRNAVSAGFKPEAGLTDFGKAVVRRMNELGVLIDVAHIGQKAWREVASLSKRPFVAGHCAMADLTMGRGEVTRERLKMLADSGGLVGVHSVAHIMRPTGRADWEERATVEDIVDHVDYVRDHVGIDFVGLGLDYFPNDESYRRAIGYNVVFADDLQDIRSLPNLTAALLRRGYSENDVRKVLGLNYMRVYREVVG